MKKPFTLLALTITFSMNAQMDDNSHPSNNSAAIYSVAMGDGSSASGTASTAMGASTSASGGYSTAMGFFTTASGNFSTASGSISTASGSYSTAMGNSTTASDYASVVIGQYNSSGSSVTNNATSFSTSNTAFVIGNGTSGNLSDAFKVLFNGDTTVSNDLTVSGDVVISSDARLKSNIVSLGSTLPKLCLLYTSPSPRDS